MKPIEASELIINKRGAVYHLNLRPEELANTIITVGDPGRVQEVSKFFDSIEVKQEHREFISHTGYIGKKRISVVSTGIGPDNIDIVINELDALVNVDFNTRLIKNELSSLHIFRLGTSGSLQDDIPVDGLVAGTHGIGLDNLLHFYQTQNTTEEANLLQAFIDHTKINPPFSAPYIAAASPL
jgi:uridine phosphorylase